MTENSQVINTYDSTEKDIMVSKEVPYFDFGQNEEVSIGVYMTLPFVNHGKRYVTQDATRSYL